jgi:Dehydrogenases with different specificities (related to short-chain alcohol dehydrogenases)
MDTAVNTFGDLNILVNNAGVTRDAMAVKMTDEQWNLVIDIHLKGAFNCIRSAGRYMAKEGHGGKIVNVASVAGLMGNIGQINYSSAKGGLISMAKTVAKEWARYGVNCNAVAYGFVLTRMTDEREKGEMVFGEAYGIPKKVRDVFMQQIGGKAMTPEQAAQPVLYLVSPESDFVTGQVLNASAGVYM